MPFKSFMSFKKTRTYLNDLNDLNDLNGKPRGGLAGVSPLPFLNGMKYLNGINGFEWHVPFKSVMSFKRMRTFLNGLNDSNDLNGMPRGGLARVSGAFFLMA